MELRMAIRGQGQTIEKLQRRVRDLEPDAERYRQQAAQRKGALAKAMEVNRARQAAKAGNVEAMPECKRA